MLVVVYSRKDPVCGLFCQWVQEVRLFIHELLVIADDYSLELLADLLARNVVAEVRRCGRRYGQSLYAIIFRSTRIGTLGNLNEHVSALLPELKVAGAVLHVIRKSLHIERDGLIDYSCAEMFIRRALEIGNKCELYSVVDKKNTHSWYTAGMFLESRDKNKGLNKLLSYVESL